MLNILRTMRNPDWYHGFNKKRDFFEGWYFKLIATEGKGSCVIIPGIALGKDDSENHSFIQIYESDTGAFEYITYPVSDFIAHKNEFYISIGESMFSLTGIALNIDGSVFNIKGRLDFRNQIKWPDSIFSPGSMGYYNYMPMMQCYSQVCALDMMINGSLSVNGRNVQYKNDRGYIEKNWGRAFPFGWVWFQCNHFTESPVSLSASIGHIPFITGSFRGFLIGFLVKERFYAFTTLNKSSLSINKTGKSIFLETENKTHILTVKVDAENAAFVNLKGPKDGRMVPLVDETIQGIVEARLIDKQNGNVVVSDRGIYAGVEFGGEQMLVAQ